MVVLTGAMVLVELETVYQIIDIHSADVRKVEIFDICRVITSTENEMHLKTMCLLSCYSELYCNVSVYWR